MLPDPCRVHAELVGVECLVRDVGDELVGRPRVGVVMIVAQREISELHDILPVACAGGYRWFGPPASWFCRIRPCTPMRCAAAAERPAFRPRLLRWHQAPPAASQIFDADAIVANATIMQPSLLAMMILTEARRFHKHGSADFRRRRGSGASVQARARRLFSLPDQPGRNRAGGPLHRRSAGGARPERRH